MRYLGAGRARTRDEVEELHRHRLDAGQQGSGLGFWAGLVGGEFVGWWILEPPERVDQGLGSRATMAAIGLEHVRTIHPPTDERPLGWELGEVEYAITREQWCRRNKGPSHP